MEKTSSLNTRSSRGSLSSFLSKLHSRLMDRLAPGSTNRKIESMLFMPRMADIKPARLPRGFQQYIMKTRDGPVQAYQIGSGPAVVFVHGWGGGAYQFFPLMRGLAQCGFTALAFDQLGHGLSERKPATLQQSIATTNHVLKTMKDSDDGLCGAVGHASGCIAIANAQPALIEGLSLLLVSPIFNFKLYFLKKLVKLNLHSDLIRRYADDFARIYRNDYQKLELTKQLARYGDTTVIVHEESDPDSPIADSQHFCSRFPLTKLLVTRHGDHVSVINSESVWQALKSHLNYDDTTINFTARVRHQ